MSDSNRKISIVVAGIVLVTVFFNATGFSRPRLVTITGWVSDSACGANHTKPGGADCVRKCLRGGAAVGHPEWKPQKLVLVDDRDGSIWGIENPDSLRGNEGRHVTLRVYANTSKRKLRVAEIESVIE